MPSPIKKGVTTIIWGSGGVLATGAAQNPSSAIVETLTVSSKNQAPIEIEDNDGFTAAMVFLDDDFNAEALCLYDTAKTWPAVGDKIQLTLPKTGAAGGTENFANCYVAYIDPDVARKREAKVKIGLVTRPGVTT